MGTREMHDSAAQDGHRVVLEGHMEASPEVVMTLCGRAWGSRQGNYEMTGRTNVVRQIGGQIHLQLSSVSSGDDSEIPAMNPEAVHVHVDSNPGNIDNAAKPPATALEVKSVSVNQVPQLA